MNCRWRRPPPHRIDAADRVTRAFTNLEIPMRKHRKVETAEERSERDKQAARLKIKGEEAADDAVDEMIRRNIEQKGP